MAEPLDDEAKLVGVDEIDRDSPLTLADRIKEMRRSIRDGGVSVTKYGRSDGADPSLLTEKQKRIIYELCIEKSELQAVLNDNKLDWLDYMEMCADKNFAQCMEHYAAIGWVHLNARAQECLQNLMFKHDVDDEWRTKAAISIMSAYAKHSTFIPRMVGTASMRSRKGNPQMSEDEVSTFTEVMALMKKANQSPNGTSEPAGELGASVESQPDGDSSDTPAS